MKFIFPTAVEGNWEQQATARPLQCHNQSIIIQLVVWEHTQCIPFYTNSGKYKLNYFSINLKIMSLRKVYYPCHIHAEGKDKSP